MKTIHEYEQKVSRTRQVVPVLGGLFAALFIFISAQTAQAATTATAASIQASQAQITNISVDNKNDFILEPGKMEVYVNPGDDVVKYVSITSRIKEKTKFNVSTEDFIGSRSEQQPVILLGKDKSPYSFKDSLIPALNTFTLSFGDRMTLPVHIVVPKDAQPGGYYASVLVSNEPQITADMANQPTSAVHIISRAGILFFIRVNGPVKESGEVQDFRITDEHMTYSSVPKEFQILFNNTGTVHLVPYGQVSVSNIIGNEIASIPVDAYFAMPNSLRYRPVAWTDDGSFRIGRYTATLTLHRGYGDAVDTRTIAFWVIPWAIVLPVLIGLIVILLGAYMFLSRFELRKKS
jgi:hypothetical protein